MPETGAKVRFLNSLRDVAETDWAACFAMTGAPYNPFLDYRFLAALEESGAAGVATGWQPVHAVLEQDGQIAGAMPLYLKGHSLGEYVFDQAWADAFHRVGGQYYPKLVSAVPFTPATGPRLLTGTDAKRATLLAGAEALVAQLNLSSLHLLFVDTPGSDSAKHAGLLPRHDQQFHFANPGYRDFADFLATLSADKRKNLRKERDKANQNVEIELLTGTFPTDARDAMFACYQDTGQRKWGRPYFNRDTFEQLFDTMGEQILLITARQSGRIVACALNFIGGDALYGRYWGALEQVPFLHFELCYYQAMDWAIAKGLPRVEAGAQGEHKVARGYAPVITTSMHYIPNPDFRRAVEHYLQRERRMVAENVEIYAQGLPFRRDNEADEP